jgi:hypothetical protein
MAMMKLGNIAKIRSGVAFRRAIEASPQGTHRVLQAKDVAEAQLNLSDLPLVKLGDKGRRHELAPGDVIMVARGRTVAAPVVEIDALEPSVAAGSVCVIRPETASVDPMYLVWAINRPETQARLQGLAQGSHIPFLSKQALEELEIPVPPLEVQGAVGRVYALSLRERDLVRKLSELREQLAHALCSKAVQVDSKE